MTGVVGGTNSGVGIFVSEGLVLGLYGDSDVITP